jgi:hypothetical protein
MTDLRIEITHFLPDDKPTTGGQMYVEVFDFDDDTDPIWRSKICHGCGAGADDVERAIERARAFCEGYEEGVDE